MLRKIGIGLIILSGVCFFSMLAVPWFPLTGGAKVAVCGGMYAVVQVSWWAGAACVGPAAVAKFKSYFGFGKRKKKSKQLVSLESAEPAIDVKSPVN